MKIYDNWKHIIERERYKVRVEIRIGNEFKF